jgi:hypothetical protein
MAVVALFAVAAALFAACVLRGWPSITVTIGDATTGADDAEAQERTPAIGFGFQIPEQDEWDEDDGSEIESRRRRAR